ncbi:tRNA lysidine(34) synthetase TilS [Maridesulfovibrio ferrireducens]|uniref:tRNA lysidine(34) synthetase TilS n=1 Tax=Maridesulfovibrio ferrireducens TaxID=246191 RepID=UPI001A2B1A98|nr:tRNA lysidine(34) synthetase TilS [Maridesulfovibrio ferrireducens]MBI9111384.1 tRNA lysidine(34) synthetase TilS [Maridesulfovibrio ferrireducens]
MKLPLSIQELDSEYARLCLDIEKFGNLKSGTNFASQKLLIAVSGGIDSTALLIISTLLARKSGGRVFCAHMDHNLREESCQDLDFVEKLCSDLGVQCACKSEKVNDYAVTKSIGLEEAGRILRYNFFNECMKKFDTSFLVLAHHLGDLCEDVVMRLIRGAGWPALGGMDAYDPNRKLLRPLLTTNKLQLEEFLKSIDCPWREDKSNFSDKWTRNRIRNHIIPLLHNENPSFGTSIARLKSQADQDQDYWNSEITKSLKKLEQLDGGEWLAPCSLLNKSHPALRCRLFKKIIEKLGKGHALADSITLLDNAYSARKTGSVFQFPAGKTATITRKGIVFKISQRY